MTVVSLSSEEFSACEILFSNPALKQQLTERVLGHNDARLASLVLIDHDENTSGACRGGMVVPLSTGRIITAVWPVAESREAEDRLLTAYASTIAGLSPPRTAALMSDVNLGSSPRENRGPFAPLTEIVRYRLAEWNSSAVQDCARSLCWEQHSPQDESAIEILQLTEEGSLDTPELLPDLNWRDRLTEYQETSPRSRLFITSVADQETVAGVAVWSVDPDLREGEIYYIGVIPAVRGCGWGKQLLSRVCSKSRERGAESIGLNVDFRNLIAIKLYESAGFREVFRKCFWISRDEGMFSTGSTHEFIDRSDF